MKKTDDLAVERLCDSAKKEFLQAVDSIDKEALSQAAELIRQAGKQGNRLHVTGIGKPSHIATYAASLISSTGTPTYFLDGTEAVHGSSGQIVSGDVVICISNSGETAEMRATVRAIRNNGGKIIGETGNAESWLAKNCDVLLLAKVGEEGGPLNRAPRNSILAEVFVLQALSVMLQEGLNLTPEDYVRRHPGGMLGKLRQNEKRGEPGQC